MTTFLEDVSEVLIDQLYIRKTDLSLENGSMSVPLSQLPQKKTTLIRQCVLVVSASQDSSIFHVNHCPALRAKAEQ